MKTIPLIAESLAEATSNGSGNGFAFPIMICAAILFVSVWLMLRTRGLKIRNRQQSSSLPASSRFSQHQFVMDEGVSDQVVEVYETIRELTGRLDTKLRLLDALIRDADRAAARIEAARGGETLAAEPGRLAESCIDEIYLYVDYGFSPSDISSRLGVSVESVVRVLGDRKPRE